ncbi:hypothetical protein ASC94_24680 [Massilia sp. Root418]|nr:hypothetical protein ASC94_24680 [Massilia sp. Root418]
MLPVLRLSCAPAVEEDWLPLPALVPLLPRLLLALVLPTLLPVPVLPLPVLPRLLPLLPMLLPLPLPPVPMVPVSDAQPASDSRAQANKVLFIFMMISVMTSDRSNSFERR